MKKLFAPKEFKLNNGTTVTQPRSKAFIVLIILIAATILSIKITDFNFSVLIKRSKYFYSILGDMFSPPDYNYLPKILRPLLDTIKMSILGSFIGSIIAIPFAIIASSNIIKSKVIIYLSRLFLGFVRTFPTLIVALVATYIFGLGTLAGTIAIAVFTLAYVGKLLYEQIETVDMGAYEAMTAIGASSTQSFYYAIVPQVMPGYIANCLFCFEGNVRYASILGYVGAGGIGLILNEKIGWREYDSVGMILIALFVAVVIIEYISHLIRKKLT